MRLPKPGSETVFAKDRFGNKILLYGNTDDCGSADGGFDLATDGRVVLDVRLARELAKRLTEYAAKSGEVK